MQEIYFPFVLMISFIKAVLEIYDDVRVLFDMIVYTTDEKYK